jgi:EAL domain-containing protein (putative c-di-GMP-specific phosphodiesterase class I)
VVAEGIETEAQLSALVARGAVVGQGYLMARPAPPDEIFRRFGTKKGNA